MKELGCGVQQIKSIRRISVETGLAPSQTRQAASLQLSANTTHQSANATQCAVGAIKVAFQQIQARMFAKSSPDTRT
jgi:hypothetical protein